MYRVPPHLRHLHEGKTEVPLGTDLGEAYRKYAALYETEEYITLMSELFDRYRNEVVSQYTSANTRNYKHHSLNRLRYGMGHNLISTITPQFIYKYRDHIGKTKSHDTANKDLEVLSHCFTKAIEWGLVAEHPMTNRKVVKFPKKARDRYVEDWELQEWASVAAPFLVIYVVLKGVTGLRQQDLLTLRWDEISETELASTNLKTGKKIRFPLLDSDGNANSVRQALDVIREFYGAPVSPWVFTTRKGTCYYNMETRKASGFRSVWQRSMAKALEHTKLEKSFTEHDLRAKVSSDIDSDIDAQKLLAHSSVSTTLKHYRRRGTKVTPGAGFNLELEI